MTGGPDLALGPDDPLGHGCFGHEERPRDLRRLEPAEQPQGQRDLGGLVQRRMTAGEDQPEPVVGHGLLLRRHGILRGLRGRAVQVMRLRVPLVADRLAAQPVDGPVAGGGHDPRAGIGRQAVRGPPGRRHGERVLDRFLGGVDIAEKADQGGNAATVLAAEDSLDCHCARVHGHCMDALTARRTRHPDRVVEVPIEQRADLDRPLLRGGGELRPLQGLVQVGSVDDPEPGEVFLGLGVRPIGHQEVAAGLAHHGRRLRATFQAALEHEGTGVCQLVAQRVHVSPHLLLLSQEGWERHSRGRARAGTAS